MPHQRKGFHHDQPKAHAPSHMKPVLVTEFRNPVGRVANMRRATCQFHAKRP